MTNKLETTKQENEKQQNVNGQSTVEMHKPTNLNSIEQLLSRLEKSPEARVSFVASHVDKGIAFQIRALRDRQGLSQEKLAEMVGMNQNAISRLESPERGHPTITTLKRLAEAFDVALMVHFVPFSQHLKWVSGTPFLDLGLSTTSLAPPSFQEESEQGILDSLLTETVEYSGPANHSTKDLSATVLTFPKDTAATEAKAAVAPPSSTQAIGMAMGL
ncbi:MAG: helix-turn-helix transcriptional regulator [Candidatus Sulfotelmatobacter sp.]